MAHPLKHAALWILLAALMIAYWPFSTKKAHGSEAMHALYTSSFSWKGKTYTFTVGTLEQEARHRLHGSHPSRFVATLRENGAWSPSAHPGGEVATCERKIMGELPFDHESILLRCEGGAFGAAAGLIKFHFAPRLKHPLLTIWDGEPRSAGHRVELGVSPGA